MNNGDSLSPPTRLKLGRYQLLKRIGIGGMGEVWLAEDPLLHRQVAIKTLPLKSQSDDEFLKRFELEARAAAALNHPHILPIHDFGKQTLPDNQTMTYIVMPYVSGGSLADRIAYYTRINTLVPQDEALEYLSQAADAIDYAHTQGVIHRDIKPGNMLLRNNQWLLLTDFGIARMLSVQTQLTQTGVGFGTPEYMAPEQAQGKAETASDNYSLAVIAFRLLTGQLPFSADTGYATTIQHMMSQPPSPRSLNPAISPTLEKAILHGLEKIPGNRPPTAKAFVNELKMGLNGPAVEATMGKAVPNTLPVKPDQVAPDTDPFIDNQVLEKATLTRRQVLIGSGALLAIGAGAGIWTLATHQSGSTVISNTPLATATKNITTNQSGRNTNPGGASFVLQGHNQPINTISWAPKGNQLYSSAQDKLIKLWDINALQLQGASKTSSSLATLNIDGSDAVVSSSPDGSYLAIGNLFYTPAGTYFPSLDTKLLKLYKPDLSGAASGSERPVMLKNVLAFEGMAWGPGKYLITACSDSNLSNLDTILTFINIETGIKTLPSLKINVTFGGLNSGYQTRQIATSPDGTRLALASSNGAMVGNISVTGNTAHWQQTDLFKFTDFSNETVSVSWSSDGRYLAGFNAYGDNGAKADLAIWDTRAGSDKRPTKLQVPDNTIELTNLTWSPAPTSTRIAACDKNGKIYIWHADLSNNNGNLLVAQTLSGLPNEIRDLAWSPDGSLLAAAYKDLNDSILIWRM